MPIGRRFFVCPATGPTPERSSPEQGPRPTAGPTARPGAGPPAPVADPRDPPVPRVPLGTGAVGPETTTPGSHLEGHRSASADPQPRAVRRQGRVRTSRGRDPAGLRPAARVERAT